MSRYSNYRYTDSSKLKAHDFYPTPIWAGVASASKLWYNHALKGCGVSQYTVPLVLDPGCGYGRLGKAWRSIEQYQTRLFGVDLVSDRMRRAYHLKKAVNGLYIYDEVHYRIDYLNWLTSRQFNIVISNPPFTYWTEFWEKTMELLADNGVFGMFAPLSYLQSKEKRGKKVWGKCEQLYVFGDRVDFSEQGSPNNQTLFAVFRKDNIERSTFPTEILWKEDWV